MDREICLIKCQNCGREAMAIEGETIYEDLMCPDCDETRISDWQLKDQWTITRRLREQEQTIKKLKEYIIIVRDEVLYPLSFEDSKLGRIAEWLGQKTVSILGKESTSCSHT